MERNVRILSFPIMSESMSTVTLPDPFQQSTSTKRSLPKRESRGVTACLRANQRGWVCLGISIPVFKISTPFLCGSILAPVSQDLSTVTLKLLHFPLGVVLQPGGPQSGYQIFLGSDSTLSNMATVFMLESSGWQQIVNSMH